MINATKIETSRLIIRELTMEDTELIYQYSIEETMKKELPDQVYDDLEEAKEVIEFLASQYNTSPQTYPLVLAVSIKETGKIIGHVGLSEVVEGLEIGYAIGMNYQGKGLATEAVSAFIDWAKDTLKINEIYGIVKSTNASSVKVLEKAGFILVKEEERKSFGKSFLNKIYIFK